MRNEDKLPPHDIEAEEAVLGSALVDPEAATQLMPLVRAEHFFREHNGWLWGALATVHKRDGVVSQITVARELAQKKKLEAIGGPAYLAKLTTGLATSVGCEYYAKIVTDCATLRRIISVAGHITRRAYEEQDARVILSESLSLIESVARDEIREGATSVKDLMIEQSESPPTHQDGVLTGWLGLNGLIGSLRKGSLYILAARPSHGKTSWATSLLRDVMTVGKRRALMFSLEMSKTQVAIRLTAATAGVSSSKIESQVMSQDDQRRVTYAQGKLGDTEGWLNHSTRSMEQIEVEAKAHAVKYGVDILVVDYLQLVEARGKESRVQEVATVSRRLKALATDMNIPVLALCQLSRAIEGRTDGKPMLSDLKESGSIEQDADGVLFLWDGQKRPSSIEHEVDVIVGKNRLGRVGSVKMVFNPETASFREVGDPVDQLALH